MNEKKITLRHLFWQKNVDCQLFKTPQYFFFKLHVYE